MNDTTGAWDYGEQAPMPREEQTKAKEIRHSTIHCGSGSIMRDVIVAAKRLGACPYNGLRIKRSGF